MKIGQAISTKHILATIAISTLQAASALAADQNQDFGIGAYGMIGWADSSDVERSPAGRTPAYDTTDTNGVNGGLGAWVNYDLAREVGIPFTAEFATTWRARHDLNIGYLENGTGALLGTKSNVQTLDFMASALWNIPFNCPLKPYIGGGAGLVYSSLDNDFLRAPSITEVGHSDDWDFAWQLQGGASYPVSDRFDVRVDYRYVDLGSVTTSKMPSADSFEADLVSQDVRIGFVWHF